MSRDRSVALALEPGLRDIVEVLEVYERLLVRWGRKINLVGNSTLAAIWTRHFMDSAQLAGFAPLAGSWVDLGSGAGFPGLVIALLQRFHSVGEMHLIESDVRKAAFLREVSRETGARAHVHNARCEDVLPSLQPAVITSRAMADIGRLVAYAQPFVEKGALGLFLKGRDVVSELTSSSIPSNFEVVLNPSKTDPRAAIVLVRAV
ncbi:MAG: 16S rRNA (guanine(527)-N(7))-methyltransferase RsmG [Rhodoblastus sp.]|nr:16S rRNA (guanine(527)-N(7))-methyltransferase RsmG [Rhodoblastus sp.]